MTIPQLLKWQWQGYPRYHQDRTNLLLHILTVPMFLLANVTAMLAVFRFSLPLLGIGIAAMAVAVGIQGRGHKREPIPPQPFAGPLNFIGRLFFEQWITFPRFVLSGRWALSVKKPSAAL